MNFENVYDLESIKVKDFEFLERYFNYMGDEGDFIYMSKDRIIATDFIDEEWRDHFEYFEDDTFSLSSSYSKLSI